MYCIGPTLSLLLTILGLRQPLRVVLKLISFTNPFFHSHSFRTAFTDLNLYCIKGALAFVLVSFSGYVCYIKLNTQLSSPRYTLLQYRIVSYRIVKKRTFNLINGYQQRHVRITTTTVTIRYDTIGEFNVDWKAEYSALSSTRSQKKKLKQPTPVPL